MRASRIWTRATRYGACLALLVSSSRALGAQQGGPVVTEDFVMDSLPDFAMVLIAQDVAAQIRKMLGARGEDAPIADGKIAWYSVPSQIVVTARRDGSMRWRGRGFLGDSSATLLLASAFDSARASSTVAMFWPDGFAADSVVMTLDLRPAPGHS